MTLLLAVVIGVLYAGGLYMMLRRSLGTLIIGLALLSHAANLLIFTVSGLARGRPPLLPDNGVPAGPVSDPLPQALILTAIVIGFGVLAFTLTLMHRTYQITGSEDIDELRSTE
ncbi:MAG TPA: Na+/H+ antiporter subunit C [Bryobacteraceae bacterium]|nr:Na+/H+ antiporter subunit C [Bryobacteraceae bacterium]HOQ46972.1 Na+/H+ antiporter subunit C [Bryobacteraceae bacterium]HPQ14987.1 Na+/H+ antiporter subunit C [Bryobacteraceae bacterium]HPU73101.1 Na+/H+ antiporter subunit C [Bryobacteraceae bacterium]